VLATRELPPAQQPSAKNTKELTVRLVAAVLIADKFEAEITCPMTATTTMSYGEPELLMKVDGVTVPFTNVVRSIVTVAPEKFTNSDSTVPSSVLKKLFSAGANRVSKIKIVVAFAD